MTKLQRVLKYLAIALAIFLTVSIVLGIVRIVAGVAGINKFFSESSTNGDMPSTTYEDKIQSLEMDMVGVELTIQRGEKFAVKTASKNITQTERNGKLTIEERRTLSFGVNKSENLTITIPEDMEFESVNIDAGAGDIEIEALKTKELELDLGAGEVLIRQLTTTEETDIDGGAGNITIQSASLHNLDLDMGVGEVHLISEITGNSDIDFGVGEANITLLGELNDYQIRMNRGLGEATFDGEHMKDDVWYGEGTNRIDMDGGVGKIAIIFEKKPSAL